MMTDLQKLYDKALDAGVFNRAFCLAGIKKLKEYNRRSAEYDELNELLNDVDDYILPRLHLRDKPTESDAVKYVAALSAALDEKLMDILELEQEYIFGVTHDGRLAHPAVMPLVEKVRGLGMNYGEYFGYNVGQQNWMEYLLDEDVDEDLSDMAEEFFRERFLELLAGLNK